MIIPLWRPISIKQLQRIKKWHVAHKADHPIDYHLFDTFLTMWVIGMVGWIPALVADAAWVLPFCLASFLSLKTYIGWRMAAHQQLRLRCDWLDQLEPAD
jgi:hypothetical protein